MTRIEIPFREIHAAHVNFHLPSVARWARGEDSPLDYLPGSDTGELFCGFRLPPFQRPEVWDEERKVRLVESVFCGIGIGSLMFVSNLRNPETDGWLIDGRQRLSAIRDFVLGKFGVFGDTLRHDNMGEIELDAGDGRVESAMSVFRAARLDFARIEGDVDRLTLMRIYERMNFGGVPHTEEQRPDFR